MRQPRLSPAPILLAVAVLAGLSACKQQDTADPSASDPQAQATPAAAPAVEAPSAPTTSPREAVMAAMDKFKDASSYHAEMEFKGGQRSVMRGTLAFVAPDRFRMQMEGAGTQTVIGDTMYMSMGGRSMQVPMPAGTTTQWRDPGHFAAVEAGMTAEALGTEAVNGVQASKYVAHHTEPQPADVTLWIGPDQLPLKLEVQGMSNGQAVTTTVTYTRFNDPALVIDAP